MSIEEIRENLDNLFDEGRISEVETFLTDKLQEALQQDDTAAVVFILNEMVGFYRVVCEYDKAIVFGTKALQILESADEEGSVHYATTMLNLATALRAAGKLEDALAFYIRVDEAYRRFFDEEDPQFASLYNNMSLVYQEGQKFTEAVMLLDKAFAIIKKYPEKIYENAVTHTNLGTSLLGIVRYIAYASDEQIQTAGLMGIELSRVKEYPDEIIYHMQTAIELFNKCGEKGEHMGAALMGLGEIMALQGDDEKALEYYTDAMDMVERSLGRVDYYYRAEEGYNQCLSRLRTNDNTANQEKDNAYSTTSWKNNKRLVKGIDICREYYERIVSPMLKKEFPELEGHICAGLFGEGSDAYGYDDMESRDHDWGAGVILLIDDGWNIDQLSQKYTNRLNTRLLELAAEVVRAGGFDYHGTRVMPDTSSIAMHRRGAFTVYEYYSSLVGETISGYLMNSIGKNRADIPEADLNYLFMTTNQVCLSACVNGEIFEDQSGQATYIREFIREYFPEHLRRAMLATEITLFSQNGQYNYRRMLQRGDRISADMLLMECVKNAARIEYLLDKRYTPHDKWLFKDVKNQSMIKQIVDLNKKIPDESVTDAMVRPVLSKVQELGMSLQDRMIEQGLIPQDVTKAEYMEDVVKFLLSPLE